MQEHQGKGVIQTVSQPVLLQAGPDGVLEPSSRHPEGLIDQTNDEYHSGPGISKSHLDAINEGSPIHYWERYINPEREPVEPTPAKVLGSAIHSAILEPDMFRLEYAQAPEVDRRTKNGKAEYDAFVAENRGKIVLSADDFARCLKIRDRVHNHPEVADLFQGGKAEQSFYAWDDGADVFDADTGELLLVERPELIKCRFDYIHDSGALAVDLKTTDDASEVGFGKSIANYRYTIQPAWYYRVLQKLYGEHPKTWVFVAVEKVPPYAIGYYFVTPEQLERARIAALNDYRKIISHRRANYWPDYAAMNGLKAILMPAWAKV